MENDRSEFDRLLAMLNEGVESNRTKSVAFALNPAQKAEWDEIGKLFRESDRLHKEAEAKKTLFALKIAPQLEGHKYDAILIEDDGVVYAVNCTCDSCKKRRGEV